MAENIRPYIIINGKNSMEVSGLLITKLPPITKPQMRVTAEEIDGRDGDIVTELGFSAYDKEIEIGLAGDYDVNDVIEYFNQSGIITFSNEPDKYYKFAQYDAIDFDKLIRFKKAKVNFHVQPFKFSTESNDDVIYAPTSFNVTNEGNIYSRPEIALQGSGNVGIVLNGSQALSINLGETKQAIVIDSNDMNAYGTKSNIKELITEINPVQDLNGYDHPWIGGAGKNLLNYDAWKTTGIANGTAVWENNGVTLTATANDCYTLTSTDAKIPMSEGETITLSWEETTNKIGQIFIFPNGTTTGMLTVNNRVVKKATYTATSGITFVTFRFGVANSGDTIAYKNIQIEKGSTATSFEPYENICPISGWNGCVITRCGTNIWDGDFESGKFNISTGAEVSDSNFIRSKNFIKVKPDTVGYVKFDNPQFIALFYDENKTYTTHYSALGSGGGYISIPSDAHYMKFHSQESTNQNDISINYPTETDEDYHAYVGSKYQSFFEGLMAGKYGFVDLGSLTWVKHPSLHAFFTIEITDFKYDKIISGNDYGIGICSEYDFVQNRDWVDNTICLYYEESTGFVRCFICDSDKWDNMTDAQFKTAMSGVYLIYELATPTTPTITQEDINMLISAFNADLVCVVFGQEVFGAHLNVTTGVLTITHGYIDLGSQTWFVGGGNFYDTADIGAKSSTMDIIATKYPCNSSAYFENHTGIVGLSISASRKVRFYNSDATSPSDVQTLLNGCYLCYKLATPTTVQLSGEDVMTLIGKNNIMSNTGAISELIYTHAGADVTTSGDIVSFDVDVGDIKDNILKNRLVTGNYDNLRLKIGTNQLGVSGDVDVIVLSNFSRWL